VPVELPLVLLGGVLGSSHCIGMCGGFAISIGAQTDGLRRNLVRQLVYSAGRLTTYVTAGAVVGFGGLHLSQEASSWVNAQALLALVAGALLIFHGLSSAGWLPRRVSQSSAGCLAGGLFAQYLRGPSLSHVLLAGILTGLLPCGLVYAFLALATSAANVASGMLIMAAFGLGTIPVMVLTGCGGSLLSLAGRARLLRLAGVAVMLTGMISIARGVSFLEIQGWLAANGCPGCQ